jgi:hypothetical protein
MRQYGQAREGWYMQAWKKVRMIRRTAGASAGRPKLRRAVAKPIPCIWCGAPAATVMRSQPHGTKLSFNVCSDDCGRKIARLFVEGTVIDKALASFAPGGKLNLPGGFPDEVARVAASVEGQIATVEDEGPLALMDEEGKP